MLMQVQRDVDAALEKCGFGFRDVDAGSERY
jgi:hypothetical protein